MLTFTYAYAFSHIENSPLAPPLLILCMLLFSLVLFVLLPVPLRFRNTPPAHASTSPCTSTLNAGVQGGEDKWCTIVSVNTDLDHAPHTHKCPRANVQANNTIHAWNDKQTNVHTLCPFTSCILPDTFFSTRTLRDSAYMCSLPSWVCASPPAL